MLPVPHNDTFLWSADERKQGKELWKSSLAFRDPLIFLLAPPFLPLAMWLHLLYTSDNLQKKFSSRKIKRHSVVFILCVGFDFQRNSLTEIHIFVFYLHRVKGYFILMKFFASILFQRTVFVEMRDLKLSHSMTVFYLRLLINSKFDLNNDSILVLNFSAYNEEFERVRRINFY